MCAKHARFYCASAVSYTHLDVYKRQTQSRQPARRNKKADTNASIMPPSASAKVAISGPKPNSSTKPLFVNPQRSYAQTVSMHSASGSVSNDAKVVHDFLAKYDLRKGSHTFRSTRSRLETADVAERFMLLVEAATCVGFL